MFAVMCTALGPILTAKAESMKATEGTSNAGGEVEEVTPEERAAALRWVFVFRQSFSCCPSLLLVPHLGCRNTVKEELCKRSNKICCWKTSVHSFLLDNMCICANVCCRSGTCYSGPQTLIISASVFLSIVYICKTNITLAALLPAYLTIFTSTSFAIAGQHQPTSSTQQAPLLPSHPFLAPKAPLVTSQAPPQRLQSNRSRRRHVSGSKRSRRQQHSWRRYLFDLAY